MVELVAVVVVLSIIAIVGGSRFFSVGAFQEMGYADSVVTAARHAHKLAISSGCDTNILINSSGYSLMQRANCKTGSFSNTVKRIDQSIWQETNSDGIAVPTTVNIYFDNIGQPRSVATGVLLTSHLCFSIGSRVYRLEPYTGYICDQSSLCACS